MTTAAAPSEYGEPVTWEPDKPKFKPLRLLISWLLTGIALLVAAAILPGVNIVDRWDALWMAAVVALLNALLPPLLAALRLPFMIGLGFILILILNALVLLAASNLIDHSYEVDNFGWALLAALVVAAVSVVLSVIFGTNDDDTYTIQVTQRIARRQGGATRTDVPGIIYLEIDGLALPVLQRAMRDGTAPHMAKWLTEHSHRLVEWETDLSSQTGASQAGILLGSNENIPAFRWVEKEKGTLMACSAPDDCAELERRHATGIGLLVNGGSSRGNLLSGEAEEVILTVSRIEAEKKANPGYRAFFANGFNVTRALRAVLLGGHPRVHGRAAPEAPRRAPARPPRRHLPATCAASMCVIVRDLIVYGVLTDMMRGRPAVYATFSSYDEVAHHSGVERSDTLEALRKLDQQFARIDRARRYAPRPYQLVVLSDHGQTQGATFKQRNGYGLDDLVERSLEATDVKEFAGGDEQTAMVGHAVKEATGKPAEAEEERRLGPRRRRARLGQPRADLPHGGEAAAHAGGAERAPPAPDPGPLRAPARRLDPRALLRARSARARREREALPGGRAHRGRRPPRSPSPRRRRSTCCAPTASRTWPTSWSAASTTRRSKRAAHSRS